MDQPVPQIQSHGNNLGNIFSNKADIGTFLIDTALAKTYYKALSSSDVMIQVDCAHMLVLSTCESLQVSLLTSGKASSKRARG